MRISSLNVGSRFGTRDVAADLMDDRPSGPFAGSSDLRVR
jgi:hypothetical protein